MCVLYVSFGSNVRPRTFGRVVMGSAVLFILSSRLLLYSAGSGLNTVQVVLPGFSVWTPRVCFDTVLSFFNGWVCVVVLGLSEVVLVPYVDALVAVTVMHVLFFACVYAERVRG